MKRHDLSYPRQCVRIWLAQERFAEQAAYIVRETADNPRAKAEMNLMLWLIETLAREGEGSLEYQLLSWVLTQLDWTEIADEIRLR